MQHGYLLEIPILLFVVGVAVAILFPNLSLAGQKVLIGVAALPVLYALYYMIVAPGWLARNGRLEPTLRVLAFLLLTVMIVSGVAMIVLSE